MPLDNIRSPAGDLYVRALQRIYQIGREVYDPDYALLQDVDAYEIFRRDPETLLAIQLRKHMIAGRDWYMTPGSDTETDKAAAEVVEKLLSEMDGFTQARLNLADAVMMGSSWAMVTGRRKRISIGDRPEMDWWVPTRLQHVDKRRFRQFVDEDGAPAWWMASSRRIIWERLGQRRQWFVRHAYNDSEDSLGYGRGLSEALYFWQFAKQTVLEQGLQGLERWAQGVITVGVDASPRGSGTKINQDIVDEWIRTLRDMRAEHALIYGGTDEVSILNGPGPGYQMVVDFLEYLTTGINLLLLGSNLPTKANDGGSFALAQVQENTTETLVQLNRMIMGEDISRDLIGLIWTMNRAQLDAVGLGAAVQPGWELVQDKREDPLQAVQVVEGLQRAGARLRVDEVLKKTGFSQAGPSDEVLEPMPAPVSADDVPGLFDQAAAFAARRRSGTNRLRPFIVERAARAAEKTAKAILEGRVAA